MSERVVSHPRKKRPSRRSLLAMALAVVASVAFVPTAAAAGPVDRPAQPGGAADPVRTDGRAALASGGGVARDRAGGAADMAEAIAAQRGISRDAAERLISAENANVRLANQLTTELGASSGGAYLSNGDLVVAVTDAAAAAKVTAAGAKARVVARGERQLQSIQRTLEAAASEPNTTWGVDPATNQVVVSLPASGAKNAVQRSVARKFGAAVRFETSAGQIQPNVGISSGDSLGGCSVGFTATDYTFNYIITAGHCTQGYPHWTLPNGQDVGPSLESNYPENDYGLIWMNGSSVWATGVINLWNNTSRSIHGWATAVSGLSVCNSGRTTGFRCGSVLKTNVTVNGAGGTVRQMVETNICTLGGDSGGPLFATNTAYGLNSHANRKGSQCNSTPRTWHQPVGEAINAYQVVIYGAP
ncbi:S1 family peptidase [Micromonospora sp. PSH03]|uniref:S1 family peptidase n=1 Tax=Micromonospora salmantinae TaxID=2911211 RepID=UPI001EE97615|nr:S1 family peptidase [Micromonospora salmantinae]MCG5454830.1 S1 family peptidase [Micromonospora salmantinae]